MVSNGDLSGEDNKASPTANALFIKTNPSRRDDRIIFLEESLRDGCLSE